MAFPDWLIPKDELHATDTAAGLVNYVISSATRVSLGRPELLSVIEGASRTLDSTQLRIYPDGIVVGETPKDSEVYILSYIAHGIVLRLAFPIPK